MRHPGCRLLPALSPGCRLLTALSPGWRLLTALSPGWRLLPALSVGFCCLGLKGNSVERGFTLPWREGGDGLAGEQLTLHIRGLLRTRAGSFDRLPELHALSSGMKAVCTWTTADGIEACRWAGAGAGGAEVKLSGAVGQRNAGCCMQLCAAHDWCIWPAYLQAQLWRPRLQQAERAAIPVPELRAGKLVCVWGGGGGQATPAAAGI